jgi:formylglycine-generating enzyme required for sulfatase activity
MALVLGLVVLAVLVGGPDDTADSVDAAGLTDAGPGRTVANTAGMVWIEPGFARLGNSEAQVRQHVGVLIGDEPQIAEVLRSIAAEPVERVQVEGFWIDKYEVTNAQYAQFLGATGRAPPPHWAGTAPPVGQEDHPVVNVSYSDAEAYAAWARKKLPTREQWLRAFRGDSDSLFPWGNTWATSRTNTDENKSYQAPSAIRATPRDASPLGAYNLVGNVAEFLRGTAISEGRAVRLTKGANYRSTGYIYGIGSMCNYYYPLDAIADGLGFRCVAEPL